LGFGHVEIGTVTPRPQPGNPRPRLHRLAADRALINSLGFPSAGAAAVARQLRRPRPPGLIVGVNLGKNRETPLERAADDYRELVDVFAPLADYLTINVSSPNTSGLRQLQLGEQLDRLLGQVDRSRREQQQRLGRAVPLLLKLAPDLTADEIDSAVDCAQRHGIDGAIATNTTVERAGLATPEAPATGGLSGPPLRARSTAVVRQIFDRAGDRLPVIAVGGVSSADDVVEKLGAGARLVQIYTGLVFRGPGLARSILDQLAAADAGPSSSASRARP
ncbi:MAG: quinone-dependent dihydroorotate dehydrogenase, partial [Deltaproteobacteria bacterium]|nr:quinone-dependent dihydroorotate dehydrogenase [Deltaproteobacteria bacterium]